MSVLPPKMLGSVRALTGVDVSSVRAWWSGDEARAPAAAGPRANQRLTALTGMLILPLAALVLLTGLYFGTLWRVHFFLGYLLLPVVLLKLAGTTYRMARYYLRSGLYRLIRPPYPLARLTSPLLALSAVVLFVSGIVMWAIHSQGDPWGWLHTDAAIAFSVLVALHLGMYLPEAVHSAREHLRSPARPAVPHGSRRLAVVGVALAAGLVFALATLGFGQFPARAHRFRRPGPPPSRASSKRPPAAGVN